MEATSDPPGRGGIAHEGAVQAWHAGARAAFGLGSLYLVRVILKENHTRNGHVGAAPILAHTLSGRRLRRFACLLDGRLDRIPGRKPTYVGCLTSTSVGEWCTKSSYHHVKQA